MKTPVRLIPLKFPLCALLGGLCLSALPVPDGSAAVVEFRNGASNTYVTNYTGAAAAEIQSGYAGYNLGGLPYFRANQSRTWEQSKGLLRFDLSALTGQALTVDSVTLVLSTIAGGAVENVPFFVHEILPANAGWVQGTGGWSTPATPGEVTWNQKAAGQADWAGSAGLGAPDVDYVSTPLAADIYNPANPTGTTISLTLPASLVQAWIDSPSSNAGLLFLTSINPTYYNEAASFESVYSGTDAWRPALILNLTAVPEPSVLALCGLAVAAALAVRRRRP